VSARVFALVLAFLLESPLAQASEKLSIGADHGTIDFDAVGGQSRNEAPDQFDRMSVDRGWRQAIADDDRKLAWAGVAVRQQML